MKSHKKFGEIRTNEKCVYHWYADQEHNPGYVHHCLRVAMVDAETLQYTRTATQFVVSHKEHGNYPFPLGHPTRCILGNDSPIFNNERDARAHVGIEAARMTEVHA